MTEIICDLPYAGQSPAQRLDLYLPEGFNGPYPVIVWLHPGGFSRGDKDMVKPVVAAMLARGYAVASVNYRLSGEATFPAQIYDAKSAVRWIRAKASKYNLDPGRIASWGVSAGSTLAALLGTSGDIKDLEDFSAGNVDQSSRVAAVISWYGPLDFPKLNFHHLQLGHPPSPNSEASGESQLMGGSIAEVPEKYKEASPITYLNSKCPPFYIQHGKADELIPYLQSVAFAGALEALIGKSNVELRLIEDAGHFDRRQSSSENVEASLDFLDRYLK